MTNIRSTVFFASVAVSLAFAWFFIWPTLQGIDSAKKAIEIESEDLRLLEEARDDMRNAAAFFSALSVEEKELIELAVPSFEDQINAVVVLDRMARENGLSVNGISTGTVTTQADKQILGKIPVSLGVKGSYPSLKAFLVRAEKSLRIFDIENITIGKDEEGAENLDLISVEIVGHVYFTDVSK